MSADTPLASGKAVERRGSDAKEPQSVVPREEQYAGFSKGNPKKRHISTYPMTLQNWHKHVDWLNVSILLGFPVGGSIAACFVPLKLSTAIWAMAYYFLTGLGVTAGYHRLWSHASYTATLPLKIFLAAMGAGAVEGSARWWARDHRAHHRFTDTTKDPYSVNKGLFYAHLGWMLFRQDPKRIGRTDISDLNHDPVVVWQHKHFIKCLLFMGFVFPTLVATLWGDPLGGFLYAGILRISIVQQSTFCINSLAHWLGDQPYDDRHTPRNHLVTAILILGEGWHNYHHEFPTDYRAGTHWNHYDPTKWAIWTFKTLGLAYDLKRFDANEIEKSRVQQTQKKVDQKRAQLNWGVPLTKLPVIEWEDYVDQVKNEGRSLVAIAGIVHDVSNFINDHPGGKALIRSGIGKDATAMFNGGVYMHGNAAHNVLSTMRVSVIRGGMEVEAWKRETSKPEPTAKQPVAKDYSRFVRAGNHLTKIVHAQTMAVEA